MGEAAALPVLLLIPGRDTDKSILVSFAPFVGVGDRGFAPLQELLVQVNPDWHCVDCSQAHPAERLVSPQLVDGEGEGDMLGPEQVPE